MVSPFETVIIKLQEIGAFQFLFPFMLTTAIFYGLLRKSRLFGPPERNIGVNAVVSLVSAFMVWAYPILVGINIEEQLSTFMFNGIVSLLFVMIGLMVVSMFFPPDLPAKLGEKLGKKSAGAFLIIGLIIGFAVFLSSGLINVFFPPTLVAIPSDMMMTIVVLIIFIITILIVAMPWGERKTK